LAGSRDADGCKENTSRSSRVETNRQENQRKTRERGIEDVEDDIHRMGIRGCRKLCMERTEWKRITEKVKSDSEL
jgi:hypothetical protein